MSLEAMVWALNCKATPDPLAKLVLLGLANHADAQGGNAWPGRDTLADYADCSVRSVSRKLGELEALGLIVRGDQRIVEHLRADRRPVVWDLVTGGLFAPPVKGQRGDRAVSRRANLTPRHGVTERVARGDTAGTQTVLEPNTPLPPKSDGCSRHTTPVDRCRACRGAQEAKAKAEDRRRQDDDRATRARIVAAEIARCNICNDYGYLPNGLLCVHDPATGVRARAGAARVREALAIKAAERGVGVNPANTPPYSAGQIINSTIGNSTPVSDPRTVSLPSQHLPEGMRQ